MTRASFGMPDTSRAARHILKDYVNAKVLYAHPPPGIDSDEFMSTSREQTLARLEAEYMAGRKRAPTTHVGKNADTYVGPASATPAAPTGTQEGEDTADPEQQQQQPQEESAPTTATKQRQLTTQSIRANAASAPGRTGSQKAAALDGHFFTEAGPAARPVVSGSRQGPADTQEGGLGFSRDTRYPHQRTLGPDGMPISQYAGLGRNNDKQHFKRKEGKKRSGKGYD
jgi:large subunit GTPase 1